MLNDALVVSLSMTHSQAFLLRNAVIDARAAVRVLSRRFAPDTPEQADCQHWCSQLDDLSSTLVQVLRGNVSETLAALSVLNLDDVSPGDELPGAFGGADALGGFRLEELDHV